MPKTFTSLVLLCLLSGMLFAPMAAYPTDPSIHSDMKMGIVSDVDTLRGYLLVLDKQYRIDHQTRVHNANNHSTSITQIRKGQMIAIRTEGDTQYAAEIWVIRRR